MQTAQTAPSATTAARASACRPPSTTPSARTAPAAPTASTAKRSFCRWRGPDTPAAAKGRPARGRRRAGRLRRPGGPSAGGSRACERRRPGLPARPPPQAYHYYHYTGQDTVCFLQSFYKAARWARRTQRVRFCRHRTALTITTTHTHPHSPLVLLRRHACVPAPIACAPGTRACKQPRAHTSAAWARRPAASPLEDSLGAQSPWALLIENCILLPQKQGRRR
ncbi:MAG: hypothetical protein J3K34DRAFT_420306 [Monoraphidium minutum]|nr:MAG: hypothetical protein J3K34DRAFT_420306 [Monoraphidium minutum]